MTERWLGYSASSERGELARALRAVDPHASIAFAHNAEELREMASGHNQGRVGVIVGLTGAGVSAVNLAAAIARDGVASEVVLVARGASGSLKSRAISAGISDVIDVALLPPRPEGAVDAGIDEPDLPAEDVPTTLAVPHTPSPAVVPEVMPTTTRRIAQREPVCEEAASGVGRGSLVSRSGQWRVVEEVVSPAGGGLAAARHGRDRTASPVLAEDAAPSLGKAGRGAVLVFVSGRGGVGKTTQVALCGAVAASWGLRVALCDLDLTCGNLYSCFGLPRGADLSQAARAGAPNAADLQRLGIQAGEGIRLWGPCSQPEMAEVVMPQVGIILRLLSARHDLVLVDTSTTFTDAVAQAAQAADRLLLVSDGGAGTAAALARLGSLAVRLGVARTRIVRVSNRCDPRGRDEVVLSRANVGLETARDFHVLEGGSEVGELMAAGRATDVAEAVPVLGRSVASTLAKVLSEMGRLPSCEEAARAVREDGVPRRRRLGRRRRVR